MDWTWLTGESWQSAGQVVLRTAGVYLALLVFLLLFGARELGQMRPPDLVLLLLISNAVQNAMVGPETSVLAGLLAALTLLLLNHGINRLRLRSPRLARVIGGQPLLLVHDGVLIAEHLRQTATTRDDILIALREHGLERIEEAQAVVLEPDGTLSVIQRGVPVLRSHRRLRRARRRD